MDIVFKALPTKTVREFQAGGLDANNEKPESVKSDGSGNPCRHCLTEIPESEEMLILSYRPFDKINPYAETGPIFLCASQCKRHAESNALPAMFKEWEKILIRGYNNEDRIVYGSGSVIEMSKVEATARQIFKDKQVAYIHMRSASYNCYQGQIERA